jgi:tol-pal system protein YbgF
MLLRNSVINSIFLFSGLLLPVICYAANKGAPVTEPSLSRIEERLANMERLLQNQGLLDMLQQIQRLQQEVTDLRGQLEVNSHKLENLEEKQRKLYTDIDNRLQRIDQRGVTANTTESMEPPPLEVMEPAESAAAAGNDAKTTLTVEDVSPVTTTAVIPETTTGTDAQVVEQIIATTDQDDPLKAQANYQEAFRLLKKAEYDQAISAFDTFLRKYPNSQYSDNAQYWMGEAYYVTRRFNEAITEYMKLITNFPASQKVPNGLLKIGYSYYELGQVDEARKVLQDLINKFPGTTAAQDAQDRLKKSSAS